jgi:BirA family transcriptional regulator, biotin operon repressor / biotin---[acetyl-CoA-carboxylase] ligase
MSPVESLANATAVQSALAASATFGPLEHHERVGSTNDVARLRLTEGADPGLVVVADRQTSGRGRAGRSWTDDLEGPAGPANLAVTATVAAPEQDAELTSLATGLAVADAFVSAGTVEGAGIEVGLKWPNDVLLGGRKAAGILVERHAIGGRDVLLIGCGLDLDWRGVVRSGETAGWTSLAEALDGAVDRAAVLGALLTALTGHLDALVNDPQTLLAAYRERCVTIGCDVDVQLPRGELLSGTAVAVDARGRLVVDTGRERVVVMVGDVTHVRSHGD